jgi:nucleotide-binding universal stress UspA family protein
MNPTPTPIHQILCPTDFSVFSARALRHAVALARQFEARLKALHVIPLLIPYRGESPYFPAPTSPGREPRRQAEEEMRRFVEPAVEARVPVQTEIREGQPWREIQTVAEEWPADLVVMGTHGRAGFEHLVLGSVAEKLLHRLPCPVLTVCHEEGRTWEVPGLVRRILCATDLSESSPRTVAFALSLAEASQAEVTLLHVLEALPEPGEHPYLAVPEIGPLRRELEQMARDQLHQAVREEVRSTVEERVTTGRAYKEILRIAATERADLIVMGTQGHGAVGRMFFGSTSHHVVRQATCPVLTVRPLAASRQVKSTPTGLAVAGRLEE